MSAKSSNNSISRKDMESYQLLKPLLDSIHQEMKELAKKKPDGILNTYKLNLINKVLQPIVALLKNEPVAEYLEVLDGEVLPSNSDVVILLGQYEKAMQMFLGKYTTYDEYTLESEWNIKK